MKKHDIIIGIVAIIIGIYLRFFVKNIFYNYDYISYKIVGNIMIHGGNLYKETTRYNYSPLWAYILGIFMYISELLRNINIFRDLICLTLSLADIGLSYIIYIKKNIYYAIFFLLNPISIVITGGHNQFDNIAILIALISGFIYESSKNPVHKHRKIISYIMLGISLSIKHIFFIFPVWIFFMEKTLKEKIEGLFIPYIIFLLSFSQYIFFYHDLKYIKANVFEYRSFIQNSIYYRLLPHSMIGYIHPFILYVFILVVLGLYMKNKYSFFDSLIYYSIAVTLFASGLSIQQVIIPLPAIFIMFNTTYLLYLINTTWLIMVSNVELSIKQVINKTPPFIFNINTTLYFLLLGFIFSICNLKIKQIFIDFINRIDEQVKEIFENSK